MLHHPLPGDVLVSIRRDAQPFLVVESSITSMKITVRDIRGVESTVHSPTGPPKGYRIARREEAEELTRLHWAQPLPTEQESQNQHETVRVGRSTSKRVEGKR